MWRSRRTIDRGYGKKIMLGEAKKETKLRARKDIISHKIFSTVSLYASTPFSTIIQDAVYLPIVLFQVIHWPTLFNSMVFVFLRHLTPTSLKLRSSAFKFQKRHYGVSVRYINLHICSLSGNYKDKAVAYWITS